MSIWTPHSSHQWPCSKACQTIAGRSEHQRYWSVDVPVERKVFSYYSSYYRGYILRIFESWTSRINKSSASVKDFYNSIKVKGIELTKALIKICHYGTFVDIPKLAEGKLEREDDLKDWEELVNSYIWGCWSCISSIITYTQTKEAVYEQFLFTSNKSQLPLWDLIVPASTEYKFSVETDFKVKDCRNEIHWDNNEEDEIIKRFNDSFFANVSLKLDYYSVY